MSTTRIKVVHVVTNLQVGGLERLVVEMIRHADRDLFEPRVVCLGERGPLAEELDELRVPVEALNVPTGRNLRLPFVLRTYFRHMGADVVHAHGPRAHFYSALTAPMSRHRVIYTKHGHLFPATMRSVWRSRLATRLSACIVGVSHELANSTDWIEKASPRKQAMIHNGIDVHAFNGCNCEGLTERPVAVMVARLAAVKDFDTLFCAVARVRTFFPSFQLRLVGDGPMRRDLELLAQSMNLVDAIQFRGNQQDVRSQLDGCRLFVLSTHTEGLSIALLEAMAARLPVVATEVGGNGEVVVDGVNGFLVPPKSPERVAECIRRLIESPADAERMGREARAHVEKNFDIRNCVGAYEQLYRSLSEDDMTHKAGTQLLLKCE